jgi:hypothetical protein
MYSPASNNGTAGSKRIRGLDAYRDFSMFELSCVGMGPCDGPIASARTPVNCLKHSVLENDSELEHGNVPYP